MFVGEAWGKVEAQTGEPFRGPAGNVLNELCLKAGIDPDACYYTNIINQQPPGNELSTWIPKGIPSDAVGEGLGQLLEEIEEVNPNIIVPLGNWPLWAFYNKKLNKYGVPTGILDYRGYVLEARKLARGRKIIPTIHPSYILQGGYASSPLAILDLQRAHTESAFSDIRRKPRYCIVDPQGEEREAIRQRLLHEGRWLCVDIEYLGSSLLCIGFAVSSEWAVTIRIRSPQDLAWCRSLIESGRPLLAQNGIFDLGILDWHYQINAMQHLVYDTMVAAYNINIEFKKDLGALGSMYTDMWAWWDVVDWDLIKAGKQDRDVVLEYNCYDNMVTYEVAEKQLPELESDPKMLEAFRFDMSKLLPLWEISKRGVKINTERIRELKVKAEADRDDGQAALNVIAETFGIELKGLDINIKSGPQMVDFLFDRVGAERGGKTSGGVTGAKKQWKTDNVTLMESMRKTKDPMVKKILELVIRTREARDLLSKFGSIEWDDDGRARCIYDPTKTVTRRLSSKTFFPTGKGSNLQNMPAPGSSSYGDLVRSCFESDDGLEFGYADLKGAEFLIVAELTQDPLMLKYARMTIDGTGDVHRETASYIFKIPVSEIAKDSPERFLGKKTRHSANYLIGWKELMGRINAEAMDTGVFVNAAEVKVILAGYYDLHPGLQWWWDEVEVEVRRTGMLRNLFGYPRRFNDRISSCLPEAVAFVPQSTVGDALNYGLVACHNDEELTAYDFQILLNVHDAIGFQYNPAYRRQALSRINDLMAIPITIPKTGNQLRIPVEIAVGPNWGELKVVKDLSYANT
jgi:uracil-DNA glycosylase family 4